MRPPRFRKGKIQKTVAAHVSAQGLRGPSPSSAKVPSKPSTGSASPRCPPSRMPELEVRDDEPEALPRRPDLADLLAGRDPPRSPAARPAAAQVHVDIESDASVCDSSIAHLTCRPSVRCRGTERDAPRRLRTGLPQLDPVFLALMTAASADAVAAGVIEQAQGRCCWIFRERGRVGLRHQMREADRGSRSGPARRSSPKASAETGLSEEGTGRGYVSCCSSFC